MLHHLSDKSLRLGIVAKYPIPRSVTREHLETIRRKLVIYVSEYLLKPEMNKMRNTHFTALHSLRTAPLTDQEQVLPSKPGRMQYTPTKHP
jgi:hypothetical protein